MRLLRPPVFLAVALAAAGCRPPVPEAPGSEGVADEGAAEASAAEWVVFASGRGGTSGVWALQPATGEAVSLVDTPADEGAPRLDAARRRVVHARYAEGAPAVLAADTTVLFPDPTGDVVPVWSPDGRWVAYVAERGGQADLFLARPDGTGEVRLTDDAVVDRYPAWAPDGDRLAFARRLATGWDLHILSGIGALASDTPLNPGASDALAITRVTSDGTYVGHPAWSPDGRRLAFDTRPAADTSGAGGTEIAVLDLATGAVERLTERPGNDLVPAWSADGRRLAFGADVGDAGGWDLWLLDLESRALTRLTDAPGFDGAPVFVPAAVLGR